MTNKFYTAAVAAVLMAGIASAQTTINGAGATFPDPIYKKWFNEYHKLHSDFQFNYQALGSGAGINQVTQGTVDFGATDGPMDDKKIADFKTKQGTDILHFPTVLGAVVPIYNLAGVSKPVNFTGTILADIFLGKITKWNDAQITKINAGVTLPNTDIVVVHRADGSGTSYCWTDYLSKVSPEWKTKVGMGTAPNWPVGLGGKGNDGVAGLVKQTANSLGYVELIFAEQNKMGYGSVQNAAGKFLQATLAGVTAAAAGGAKTMPADFRVSIVNSPGAAAYPISTYTWLLVPVDIKDAKKKEAIKGFLQWMLKDGQGMTEALSYAQLPKEVVAQETKALAKIK
ncbi:MAG: phosphate ABC transporter substrate-binding protein PstS [Acidobacteriota bacterium]